MGLFRGLEVQIAEGVFMGFSGMVVRHYQRGNGYRSCWTSWVA
jgi:transcription antitermination factor NusG